MQRAAVRSAGLARGAAPLRAAVHGCSAAGGPGPLTAAAEARRPPWAPPLSATAPAAILAVPPRHSAGRRRPRAPVAPALHQRRWASAEAEAEVEDGGEEEQGEPAQQGADDDFDRNPISTKMRQCETKHDVAVYMLEVDPSMLLDTHDLEAARLFANLEGPLTSTCGRVMDKIAERMTARYRDKESEAVHSHTRDIATGKSLQAKMLKRGDPKGRRKKKLSASIGTFVEFAQWYAQVYYQWALQRPGGPASVQCRNSPLYALCRQVAADSVGCIAQRATRQKGLMTRDGVLIPNVMLTVGLLGLSSIWHAKLQRHVCTPDTTGRPPYTQWLDPSGESAYQWDVQQVTNVLFGATQMELHKKVDTSQKQFVEACLGRCADDDIMLGCGPDELIAVLRFAAQLRADAPELFRPSAKGGKVFKEAAKRITRLAVSQPGQAQGEVKALAAPSGAPSEAQGEAAPVSAAAQRRQQQEAEDVGLGDDFSDTEYLIGVMSAAHCIEVLRCYTGSVPSRVHVYRAVCARVLRAPEVRAEFSENAVYAVELVDLLATAQQFRTDVFTFVGEILSQELSWQGLGLDQVMRVLVAYHTAPELPVKEAVYAAAAARCLEVLAKRGERITHQTLANLRKLLNKCGLKDPTLEEAIDSLGFKT